MYVFKGNPNRDRSDIRCFDGRYELIEMSDVFNERRLKVLIFLSVDRFKVKRISKREIWPLYLRVHNLCLKEANNCFNSSIAGAFYSRRKPTEKMMETLLSRLECELHDLRDEPIEIVVDEAVWKIEVRLNHGIADMAAQQVIFGILVGPGVRLYKMLHKGNSY
ncbi:hypothetical protein Y032_0269g818 [Ancylostoma ceylanicum]|uniref:Uncharacterized protein n=1 Tax=Ancylostoma ceylanicum TaxID=53326 RepID=A0A016S9W1_9BILA|nr:hypothetical protein Y032_0269g818 [Ancylostoma ceylanicum]